MGKMDILPPQIKPFYNSSNKCIVVIVIHVDVCIMKSVFMYNDVPTDEHLAQQST